MVVLGIETATETCGVAVCDGEVVVHQAAVREPRKHAERLAPMIAEALEAVRLFRGHPGNTRRRADADGKRLLDGISVSAGPGSYTGLRIGVSTAKGLALAFDVPMATVSTLECIALSAARTREPETVIGILHARNDEWYAGTYRVCAFPDRFAVLFEVAARPSIVTTAELLRQMEEDESLVLGMIDSSEAFGAFAAGRVRVVEPAATYVASQGARQLVAGQAVDIDTFEPDYLREFVARKSKGSIFRAANE
jgi:tRNA threonylcarbamoyladenosine biosynthesis protein TsaB